VTRFADLSTTAGKWLYRIKAVSLSNEAVYSRILEANTTCAAATVTVYPSPARDMINISLKGSADATATYSITDNLGRVVKQGKIDANNLVCVTINDLNNGLYHVRVVYGGNVYTQRIDILK
jgi:hypothetical protein